LAEVNGKAEPRFFDVEDRIDSVTFDLLNFKLVSDSSSGSVSPNNMEIPLPDRAMGNLTEKAKSAFDQQFNNFLEKAKGIDTYTDATELYKINQVYNKRDTLLPVSVQYVVTAESPLKPTIKYADEWMNEWDDDKSVYASICEQSDSLPISQQNLTDSIKQYIELTNDPILLNFLQDNKFDFCAALTAYENNKGIFELETRMIVGNLYSDQNSELIHSLLDYRFGDKGKLPSKGILWNIEPSDKIWGRCPELESFISSLEQRLDERRHPVKTVLAVPVSSVPEAFKVRDRYGIRGCKFQGMNKSIGNSQTEILIIPGALVACTFHFLFEHHYPLTLPIGFVTTDEKRVERIDTEMRKLFLNGALGNHNFEKRDIDPERTVLNSTILKILQSEIKC
jgi:hypothetical protein